MGIGLKRRATVAADFSLGACNLIGMIWFPFLPIFMNTFHLYTSPESFDTIIAILPVLHFLLGIINAFVVILNIYMAVKIGYFTGKMRFAWIAFLFFLSILANPIFYFRHGRRYLFSRSANWPSPAT